MRKWLNKPWVVLLLVIAAALGCWDQWPSAAPRGTTSREPTAEPQPSPAEVPSSATAAEELPALSGVALTGPWREVFPVKVVTEPRIEVSTSNKDPYFSVTLSALWTQGAQRLAVVNNTIAREGQHFEHFSIDRFEGQGVWIRQGETLSFLDFGKSLRLRLTLSPPSLASSPSP